MLNSFWGKFGQRPNMKQCKFINEKDLTDFYSIMTDPTKTLHNFHILTDKVATIEWTHDDLFVPESDSTSVFVATFTTCYARLYLYKLLDQLQRRVLYYDTDSVIFVDVPGQECPALGDYLGELTDELKKGDSIDVFASGGPNNYCYKTKSGEEKCKVRGFTLNHVNAQLINFNTVRDMVLAPLRNESVDLVNPSKISRDKHGAKIYNRREIKRYQVVYTKRVIRDDLDTLPYGYK
jgi:hypothetical protein